MWRNLAKGIRALPWVFWLIVVPGFALPWAIGVGVKLYLHAQGRPTVPWEYFVNPASLLLYIPFTIFWAIPHIALGLITTTILQGRSASLNWATQLEKCLVVGCAFVFGTVGLVWVFVEFFWEFDPRNLLIPLPIFYGAHMAVGAVVGYVIAWASARISPRNSAPQLRRHYIVTGLTAITSQMSTHDWAYLCFLPPAVLSLFVGSMDLLFDLREPWAGGLAVSMAEGLAFLMVPIAFVALVSVPLGLYLSIKLREDAVLPVISVLTILCIAELAILLPSQWETEATFYRAYLNVYGIVVIAFAALWFMNRRSRVQHSQ